MFSKALLLMHQNEYLWSKGLTVYHTIPIFNDPVKVAFWKHCGKRRKYCVNIIFSFSHNVSSTFQEQIWIFNHIYFAFLTCLQFCHLVRQRLVQVNTMMFWSMFSDIWGNVGSCPCCWDSPRRALGERYRNSVIAGIWQRMLVRKKSFEHAQKFLLTPAFLTLYQATKV